MILKEAVVFNYRKFLNTSLSLTGDITLLAGANNSGKTSFIDLLESILQSNKTSYSVSDIPVTKSSDWIEKAYPIFCEIFDKKLDKEVTKKEITNKLFSLDPFNPEASILIQPTLVKIKVDYNESDDIRNFADYIMDFDSEKHSFYFIYSFHLTPTSFGNALDKNFDKLKSRYEKIENPESEIVKVGLLKDKIIATYADGIIEQCYYTDEQTYLLDLIGGYYYAGVEFSGLNKMEPSDFRALFNFKNIHAGRTLDDQNNGKTKSLSKNMIELAEKDDSWKKLIDQLPDKILQPIEQLEVARVVRETSVDGLSETVKTISKANGGNTGDMVLDIDITEESISSLINQITKAKYQLGDHFLNEASQGLGYSNMIFIILQLENYKRNIDPFLINFFVIEEPESHMHPQMQNVFAKYLRDYYQQKKIQGLITTHSSEMVRVTDMKNLRVARPLGHFEAKILDFSTFKEKLSGDTVLDNFYDWFYEMGFSEIVFADRAILYEGDTERMLIRKLSTLEEYEILNQQYIAFIQVGGAYAYNYKNIIEFLKIKTLILTDLDYKKSANTADLVKSSETTNSTINKFYNLATQKSSPKISELYDWEENKGNILLDGCAYIGFQCETDDYARTLEEAMLAKHYKIKAFEKKRKSTWEKLRTGDGLKYTIPQEPGNYSLRDIVAHTSNNKTDFMYSVILNKLTESMLPDYIKEGLKWLMQ